MEKSSWSIINLKNKLENILYNIQKGKVLWGVCEGQVTLNT